MKRRKDQVWLVSCVKKKLRCAAPARILYDSDWFHKARAYVEGQKGRWFILSAKHHLVRPARRLRPYNCTLHRMPAAQRRAWSVRVLEQLRRHCKRGTLVTILAGTRYREHLEPNLRRMGCVVWIPLAHLGSGRQKQWPKRALARQSTSARS